MEQAEGLHRAQDEEKICSTELQENKTKLEKNLVEAGGGKTSKNQRKKTCTEQYHTKNVKEEEQI